MNTYKLYKEVYDKQIRIEAESEWEEIERGRADTVEYVEELKSDLPEHFLPTTILMYNAVVLLKSEENL